MYTQIELLVYLSVYIETVLVSSHECVGVSRCNCNQYLYYIHLFDVFNNDIHSMNVMEYIHAEREI
jgi:hypothetical protein